MKSLTYQKRYYTIEIILYKVYFKNMRHNILYKLEDIVNKDDNIVGESYG